MYIFPQNIWGIGDDADKYIDRSYNLSAILKLIDPPPAPPQFVLNVKK